MASYDRLRTATASSYKFGSVKDMGIFLVFRLVKLLEAESSAARHPFPPSAFPIGGVSSPSPLGKATPG